ncbi:MAG: hypothetical protein H0W25_06525 [Acidimicrobiia bacterium]|nr:hypothetical protein [Acidimicrobiia bacterium]
MPDDDRSGRWGWTLWSAVGIAAWMALTVRAAATLEYPSDPGPVLRTFAIAGGVFFVVTYVAAGVSIRRRRTVATERLVRRLAPDADTAAVRRAARRSQRSGLSYTFFGAVTTGLLLTASRSVRAAPGSSCSASHSGSSGCGRSSPPSSFAVRTRAAPTCSSRWASS